MNIKKMFTTLSAMVVAVTMTMPSAAVFGATYSEELQGAYDWAYEKGVTTMSSIDNANMYGAITRSEMAKMLSVYATEVLGYKADTSKACTFSDIDSVKGDLHDYIIESCQLGLMGQGITAFRPYDTISRAEFGTALSRTLWGDQYEGGNPYYAKHLDALKAAGIMNQIANAEATKEVRGYVMLMLQRSEENGAGVDCDDEDIVLVCLQEAADGKYEECPAACRVDEDNNNEDEVVKSGSLVVTANANSSKKVVKAGTSDMDTLTFKTSEEVNLTKIVLERYGRSYRDSIDNVWLEDEDGNVLTTSQDNTINSKDKVTLSLKKDYRLVDGTLNAIIRVSATNASGSTIGFKVADVTSTAKDVDLGNYTPTEYDIIDYDVSNLTVSANATTKSYNYVAGDSYEVAKFKLRAGTAAVKVRGFTLYNLTGLSDEEFVDSLAVAFDGKEVKNLSYNFDSDDNLVVSFDDQEIAINKSATVTVTATFAEDFDEYGQSIQYAIRGGSDVKAIESKTSSSVVVTGYAGNSYPTYTFEGSKVKLAGENLGNVDAAQGAEGILIAEGTITLSEAINKGEVRISANHTAGVENHVDHLTLSINGDEYDSKWNSASGYYYFSNVEVEESGKVKVKIDINENENASGSITFGSLQFVGFKYVQNKNVTVNPTGTIKVSKVTLQPAKATMSNDLTKSVQFIKEESARKVVFEGTYTAKKGDIYLNKFMINTATADAMDAAEKAAPYNYVRTFYVYVDGEEVGDTDEVLTGQSTTTITENTSSENFSNVLVKKGESVKIKVEAEIDATTVADYNYDLFIWGTDENDNTPSGIAYDSMVTVSVVAKGTVTIPTASSSKNTVLKKAKNQTLATFTVKPSNNNEGINLENLVLAIDNGGTDFVNPEDYRVRVEGVDYSDDYTLVQFTGTNATGGYYYLINEELPTAGLTVEITLKEALTGTVTAYVLEANSDTAEKGYTGYNVATGAAMKSFKAKYASALVYIASQTNDGGVTSYKLGVDKYDDDYQISTVVLGTGGISAGACTGVLAITGNPTEDGDSFEIVNGDTVQMINCISYTISDGDLGTATENVVISTDDSSDYFKVNGASWRVYNNK